MSEVPMVAKEECRIDVFETAVHPDHPGYRCALTVTHVPSGLVETCDESRSRLQNEWTARTRLAARLAGIR
jgi:protein subunit release factor A